MKHKLIAVLLAALLVALLAAGCGFEEANKITFTPSVVESPAEGGEHIVVVFAPGQYTVVSGSDFITATLALKTCIIDVAPNTGPARTGSVLIQSSSYAAILTVNQAGVVATPALKVTGLPQTSYVEGDALDLTGLALTHTDQDSQATQLSYNSAGVSASIAHGTALAVTDTVVTMSYDGLDASFAIIVSAKPPAPTPTPDDKDGTPPATAPTFTSGPSVVAGASSADFTAAFSEYCTYNVIVCSAGTQSPNGYRFSEQSVEGRAQQGSVRTAHTLTVSGLASGTEYVAFLYGASSKNGLCTELVRLEFRTLDGGYYTDDSSSGGGTQPPVSTPTNLPQNIVLSNLSFYDFASANTIGLMGAADKACTVYAVAVLDSGPSPTAPTAAQVKAVGSSTLTGADNRFGPDLVLTHDIGGTKLDALSGNMYHVYLYAENANGRSAVTRLPSLVQPHM